MHQVLKTSIPANEDTVSALKENAANQPERRRKQYRTAASSAKSSQKDSFAGRMKTQTSQ